MAIMSIYGGRLCPDVNESHYMTKAKNFWDSSFCEGDLFLESADAHWFFFVTFGLATKFFSLPVATWIGRCLCWFALSCGWCRLAGDLAPMRLIGAASSLLFIAASHFGQLSGEWVIGGCEAKCVAYGFAFLGLAAAMRNEWNWSFIHFGIACAFHIITGGWIFLALVAACLLLNLRNRWKHGSIRRRGDDGEADDDTARPSRTSYISGAIVGLIFLGVGLVPAIALNANADLQTKEQGAMIYVFARLPHHLRISGFSSERWAAHGLLVICTAIVGLVTFMTLKYGKIKVAEQSPSGTNRPWPRSTLVDM